MRNRYFDLLRALAILRVVVYHATGWAPLTLVFPAMSLMFALGGSLMAASLDRRGVRAVGSRMRRLLPPVWMFAAVYVPLMLATGLALKPNLLLWVLPLSDTPDNLWGNPMVGIMWYVRQYIWFVLVSPLFLPLFRRFPLPTIIAPFLLLASFEVGVPRVNGVIGDFGLYFGAWLLGFAHHDGMLARLSRRALFTTVGLLTVAAAAWILTHPGTRNYDLNDIKFGNGLWSTAFLLLLLTLAPASMRWLERFRPLDRLVTVLNRRAVTVFLWHQSVIYGVIALAAWIGFTWNDVSWMLRVPAILALVIVPVVLFGWVEDLASKRRPELIPGGGRPATTPAGTDAGVHREPPRPRTGAQWDDRAAGDDRPLETEVEEAIDAPAAVPRRRVGATRSTSG